MNVVVLSNIDWQFLKQRHHYVAEAFLERGDTVVFVESTGKRLPGLSDIGRILRRVLRRSSPSSASAVPRPDGLAVVSPVALPSTNRLFNWINRTVLLRRLGTTIAAHTDDDADTLVYAFLPTTSTNVLVDLLDADQVVYDCVSNYSAVEAQSPGITRSERQLVERADLVLVDCEFLHAKHREHAKRIAIFEPVVPYGSFAAVQSTRPTEVRSVAYFGLFDSHKIDVDAVAQLANDVEVTIIGPVGKSLPRHDAITYVDPVAHDRLPALVAEVDGLLLPYNSAEFTKGIMPAKFFECLATGLPVFALRTPNFSAFEDCIYLADDAAGLLGAIDRFDPVADEPRRARRIELAAGRDTAAGKRELRALIESL